MDFTTLIILGVYLLVFIVYFAKINTSVCTISISGASIEISGCDNPTLFEILPKLRPFNHGLSLPSN
uniref:Movement protein TGBp3 n=1 Tax=White clover mosaic virus TaxID=12188 RepID=A0A6M6ABT5_9VIRU|nr:triple gene block protein 3 [White clover mosaic virus]QWT83770.1 triple gene block 3 protein [White clover mosaic virus]